MPTLTVEQLTRQITRQIQQALDMGLIDRNRVAQMVAGPSRDFQAICLWYDDEWEEYHEYADENAFAEVSNADWLDQVDSLVNGGFAVRYTAEESNPFLPRRLMQFADPAQQNSFLALIAQRAALLKAALRAIAQQRELGDFKRLLGLRAQGVSNSGYADLVAFYHPQGALPLWPLREQRPPGYDVQDVLMSRSPGRGESEDVQDVPGKGACNPVLGFVPHQQPTSSKLKAMGESDGSLYGWGVFTADGLIHFYPNSESEDWDADEDSHKSPCWWKEIRFSEIDYYYVDRWGDFILQYRDDGRKIQLDKGHTHEEWGGPGAELVKESLIEHFRRHIPASELTLNIAPNPLEPAFKIWIKRYAHANVTTSARLVRSIAAAHGPAAAQAFLARLTPEITDRQDAWWEFACVQLAQSNVVQALDILQTADANAFPNVMAPYFRCLLLLRRNAQVIVDAESKIAKPDKYDMYKLAAFKALALCQLHRENDALDELNRVTAYGKTDAIYLWARARALITGEPNAALTDLRLALRQRDIPLEYAQTDFQGQAALLEEVRLFRSRLDQGYAFAEFFKSACTAAPFALVHADPYDSQLQAVIQGEGFRYVIEPEPVSFNNGDAPAKLYTDGQNRTWAMFKDHLAVLHIAENGQFRYTHRTPVPALRHLCVDGEWLYAGCDTKLIILRIAEKPNAPATVIAESVWTGASAPNAMALDGNWLVAGTGACVEVYDVSDRMLPKLFFVCDIPKLSAQWHSECQALALSGDTVYLFIHRHGLVAARIGEHALQPLSHFALAESAGELTVNKGLLHLQTGCKHYFLDVRDPSFPKALGRFGADKQVLDFALLEHVAQNEFGYLLFDTDGFILHVSVHLDQGLRINRIDRLYNQADDYDCIDNKRAWIKLDNGGLAVINKDAVHVLRHGAMPELRTDIHHRIAGADAPLLRWIHREIAEFAARRSRPRFGVLQLGVIDREFHLDLDGPRSLAGIERGPIERFDDTCFHFHRSDTDWHALLDIPETDPTPSLKPFQRLTMQMEARLAGALCRRVLAGLSAQDVASQAAGEVYLVQNDHLLHVYIKTLTCADSTWQPWRRRTKALVSPASLSPLHGIRDVACAVRTHLSLSEALSTYKNYDSYEADARKNVSLRRDILALARQNHAGALIVAWRLRDLEPRAVVDAYLTALDQRPLHGFVIEHLGEVLESHEVHERLQWCFEKLKPVVLAADFFHAEADCQALARLASVLNKQNDADVDRLIYRLAEHEKRDHRMIDTICDLLVARRDKTPFKAMLNGILLQMKPHDPRLPRVAEMYFHAGGEEVPPMLWEGARREKAHEQYDDVQDVLMSRSPGRGESDADSFGIQSFDERFQTKQYPICRTERLFTGRIVAGRIRAILKSGQWGDGVWPSQWEKEPYAASWAYFIAGLFEQLHADEIAALVDLACGLTPAQTLNEGDRALLPAMVRALFHHGQMDQAVRLAERLILLKDSFDDVQDVLNKGARGAALGFVPHRQPTLRSPVSGESEDVEDARMASKLKAMGESDKDTFRQLLVVREGMRVHQAGAALTAGDLPLARRLADDVLQAGPIQDNRIYFIDARLRWLESGNPEAAIDAAQEYIYKVSDMNHKAQLKNLIGCALDELGRPAGALPYFMEAALLNPDMESNLVDIAQCHAKLGQERQAFEWAQEAIRRGSKSEICRSIVAKFRDNP